MPHGITAELITLTVPWLVISHARWLRHWVGRNVVLQPDPSSPGGWHLGTRLLSYRIKLQNGRLHNRTYLRKSVVLLILIIQSYLDSLISSQKYTLTLNSISISVANVSTWLLRLQVGIHGSQIIYTNFYACRKKLTSPWYLGEWCKHLKPLLSLPELPAPWSL